ncbi:MAG: ProQ/FINO family protein [Proteobacteria bacterium]|nr:ProQ/FINO family protein [Pseudomonadota bacterium]
MDLKSSKTRMSLTGKSNSAWTSLQCATVSSKRDKPGDTVMVENNLRQAGPRELLKQLSSSFEVFRDNKPLALGIHKAIRERLPDINRDQLRIAMQHHTGSTRYLKALATEENRFDLNGQFAGVVTPEQNALAATTLRERFRRAAEQRKADEQARQRQEKLLKLAEKFNSR